MAGIIFVIFFMGAVVGVLGVTIVESIRSDAARNQCVSQNGGEECVFQHRFVPKNAN